MVVMVGGKVVPNGSNYSTLLTTTGGPAYLSEEKEEVDSVDEVEAEVIDEGKQDNEFSNYIENLPKEIEVEEGKADAPAAAAVAKEAKTGNDDEDDGGGKPAATAVAKRRPRRSIEKDRNWLANVDMLRQFKKINGHCNVPYHRPPNLTGFMSWCHMQRRHYKTGNMDPNRIQILEEAGFHWSAKSAKDVRPKAPMDWDKRLAQLKAYKETHGTLEVDRDSLIETEMQLTQWCHAQREKYHSAKLAADRVQKLDAIDFDWGEPTPASSKKEPGTPANDSATNKRPANSNQMSSPPSKRGKSSTRGAQPASVATTPAHPPVPPPPDEEEWVEMHDKLVKLKRKNKKLPDSFPQDKQLDRWVRHQKQLLRKQDLERSRMERLVRLGLELPPGTTLETYQSNQTPIKTTPSKKKSPLLQTLPKKPSPQQQSGKKMSTPAASATATPGTAPAGGPSPRAFPHGPPPGAFPPGMVWNPFSPPFPFGHPNMQQFAMGNMPGGNKSPNGTNMPPPPMPALQMENNRLRAENDQLQAMHRSIMTSLEEEKMVRRQGNQELQTKIEKQEEIITIQGATIKKQDELIKQVMEQMTDVVTRQKEQQRVHEERAREQQRREHEEQIRQAELQRQREMAELQRQQEEQERAEQARRQEIQRQELYALRHNIHGHHGLY